MAGEGLSGFDAKLVADAGGDVVAEPVGCQRLNLLIDFSIRFCVTDEYGGWCNIL